MNGKESQTEQTLALHAMPMRVCVGGCVMEHILLDVRMPNVRRGRANPWPVVTAGLLSATQAAMQALMRWKHTMREQTDMPLTATNQQWFMLKGATSGHADLWLTLVLKSITKCNFSKTTLFACSRLSAWLPSSALALMGAERAGTVFWMRGEPRISRYPTQSRCEHWAIFRVSPF